MTETGYPNREEYWKQWVLGKTPVEIAEMLAEKETLSETDALTELKNRRGWENSLKLLLPLALENRWKVSFVVADLDGLKGINNEYGHEAGDQAIIFLADILNSSIRRSDILARVGGDEFYMCLPQTDIKDAKILTERIKTTIKRAIAQMDKTCLIYTVFPKISVGSSQLQVGEIPDKAIKRADFNMYEVKKNNNVK